MAEQEVFFDLWHILVEVIFGSVWLSGLVIGVVFLLMGMIARMSFPTLSIILLTYFMAFFTGYYGVVVIMPVFLFAVAYFISGVYGVIRRMTG